MSQDVNSQVGSSEDEQIEHRRGKLTQLRAKGYRFPNDFRRSQQTNGRDHTAQRLNDIYRDVGKTELEAQNVEVQLSGRLMVRRGAFLVIEDGSGRFQFYLQKNATPEVKAVVDDWDVGDIVGGAGRLERSGKGDLFVNLARAWLLTKSLRPLPDLYYGLADHELRYRRRYLDLIVNEQSRNVFRIRSKVIDAIRAFLRDRDYMEVETPMLHTIPGGAYARPFQTHHNALDVPMFLRIAPELFLKRLVVGGFERVFEINRNFRNEGISYKHYPEFTMLEFYQAYADYHDLMDLTEQMLREVTLAALGTSKIQFEDCEIDFAKPIPRLTVADTLIQRAGIPDSDIDRWDAMAARAQAEGIEVDPTWGVGRLQFELFEKIVEPNIKQPIFVVKHPTEVSPLARRCDADPEVTDRFELFIMGREIANGFSELNDAEDQAARFRAQAQSRADGDHEAMHYDEDYVTALEYGLPPTAGEGIGIDRLVMLLTNQHSIRDVLLFPTMRRKSD